jgi:hypothetical protein
MMKAGAPIVSARASISGDGPAVSGVGLAGGSAPFTLRSSPGARGRRRRLAAAAGVMPG